MVFELSFLPKRCDFRLAFLAWNVQISPVISLGLGVSLQRQWPFVTLGLDLLPEGSIKQGLANFILGKTWYRLQSIEGRKANSQASMADICTQRQPTE